MQYDKNISQSFWRDDLDPRPVLVTVSCLVYNQEKYIRQMLDGLVMQQTDFRFEAIVHDDASTDGTADIVREYAERYPSIIKPICETENKYSLGARVLNDILDAHTRGKYIAYCEGDDYWIDPLKLQKQVDAFRNGKDVSLVYTGFDNVDDNGNPIFRLGYKKNQWQSRNGDILPNMLLRGYHVQTCTAMVLASCFDSYFRQECPRRQDTNIFISAASEGKAVFLPEHTAAYRLNSNGLTHTQFKKVLETSNIIIDFAILTYLQGKMPRRHGYNQFRMLYAIACRGMLNGKFGEYAGYDRRLRLLQPFVWTRHHVRKGIIVAIDKAVTLYRKIK